MVPPVIVVLNELPLTPSGKIDRRALPHPGPARDTQVKARNRAEELLCQIFAETLATDTVGIHDNFFALGGHSLLTARVVSRVRAALGIRVSPRTLFEAPTVAELAARLTGRPPPTGALGPVLALRSDGRLPPLFCLPPATGLGWSYTGLLRALDPGRPVYALQAPGLTSSAPLPRSVEQIAQDCLARIQEVQRCGPYHLCGWSFGGLVAYAIASRLQRMNVGVGVLALLDSYPIESAKTTNGAGHRLREFADLLRLDVRHLQDSQLDVPTLVDAARTAGHPLALLDVEVADRVLRLSEHHWRLMQQFRPERYDGDLLFLAGAEAYEEVSPGDWRRYVNGRIRVQQIGCGHLEMLDPGPVVTIGRLLEQQLRLHDELSAPMENSWRFAKTGDH
jgi:thioesterase domain-containing protein/acyl carrier protein